MKHRRAMSYFFLFFFITISFFISGISSAEPLDNWHVRNSPVNESLRSVTYGNGMFVAVGNNGTIITSTDGSNWLLRSSGTTAQLNGIIYGQGIFAAVGFGSILTSYDGITWTSRPIMSPLLGVTYGKGMFAAVGYGADVATSTDGVTWTIVPLGLANPLYGITFGQDTFVAVGGADAVFAVGAYAPIVTSSDGANWALSQGTTNDIFAGITHGKSIFASVGSVSYPYFYSHTMTSPDGINWTIRESIATSDLNGITYGDGYFIAVGSNGTILSSALGAHWIARQPGTTKSLKGAVYGNGTFVAVGENGTILQSDPMAANTDCTSILSSDLSLHVPIIDFSGTYLWADLQYEAGTPNDIMLKVTYSDFVSDPLDYSSCQASTLSYDTAFQLHVPSINYNNLFYRADLEYIPTDDGQIWFKLTDATQN